MSDVRREHDRPTRNRAPCVNCQSSKRKCDRSQSHCSRCRQQNLQCIPSSTAQWRVSRPTKSRPPVAASTQYRRRSQPAQTDLFELSMPPASSILSFSESVSPAGGLTEATGVSVALESDSLLMSIGEVESLMDPNADDDFASLDNRLPLLLCEGLEANDSAALFPGSMFPDNNPTHKLLPVPTPSPSVLYLWEIFHRHVAPGITLEGRVPENRVTKHIASQAIDVPPLFSAVLFMAYSVRENSHFDSPTHIDSNELFKTALEMEQTAVSYITNAFPEKSSPMVNSPSQYIISLSILVALCSAYIARGDMEKLSFCLERASDIARLGIASNISTDETFLFLVRWIGLIHTTSMLGEATYNVNAPDYLTIARSKDYVATNSSAFFQDVDSFLGVSEAVGDILYRVGKVLRCSRSPNYYRDKLKQELMDVETRTQLLLQRLDEFKFDAGGLRCPLDFYNEALVHTGLLLLYLSSNQLPLNVEQIDSTVSRILDACAAVPETSPVAKLQVLPMFMAGTCTSRPVYQAFIRQRLQILQAGCSIVNVQDTMEVLEERWNQHKIGSSILSSRKSSVCLFF